MTARQSGIILQHVRNILTTRATDRSSDRELLRRYAHERDESAFATLVRRHGPLVLRVCQRVLHNWHDAEDAFQATFLVLARQAAARKWRASISTWLYLVAYRLALRIKTSGARHSLESMHALERSSEDPLAVVSGRELCGVLDEELSRLPENYRAPLVLCYLEGLTRDEAARQLDWSLGTFKRRLERGRAMLRQRLVRRGFPLAAVLATVLGTEAVTRAALPLALGQSAVQLAMRIALAKTLPVTFVSARVDALAEGALRSMGVAKLKTALTALLAVCIAGAGAGLAFQQTAPKAMEPTQAAAPKPGERSEAKLPRVALDRSGDPLPAQALARLGTLRFRHGGTVKQIAFSPDGEILASACSDGVVYLWEASTGKELRRHESATADTNPGVAISPDGKLLVAGGFGDLRRWDLATGRELPLFKIQTGTVGKLTFSPNGRVLACLGHDRKGADNLIFLDAVCGKELHRLVRPAYFLSPRIAFSPDSSLWAYVNRKDKRIWLHDTQTGKEIRQLIGHANDTATVAFSPDGKIVASTDKKGVLLFWEVATGAIRPGVDQFYAMDSLSYSPDGKFLAKDGFSLRPHLYEVATGQELNRFETTFYSGDGNWIAFSPDGKVLACPIAHLIYIWDVLEDKALYPLQGHRQTVGSLAFAPDAKTLATASGDLALHLWESATGKELFLPTGLNEAVYAVAYSPDGQFLAVGTSNEIATIWLLNPATGEMIAKFAGPKVNVTSLAFSADSKILIGKYQSQTILWNMVTGKELRRFEAKDSLSISDAALSPDGKTVADANYLTGPIHLWDVATGKELRQFNGNRQGRQRGINAVAISPDGKLLASGGADKTVRLWDLETGKELQQMRGHQSSIRFVAFSPDGKTLASGGYDKTVRLWEVATGQQRCLFEGHRNPVRTGAFSADGKMLATGGEDTTTLVWDLTGGVQPRELAPKELESRWTDLAAPDAAKAYGSIRALAGSPRTAVAFLKDRLRPVATVDPRQVVSLLAGLDNDRSAERDKATQDLEKLGFAVEPALRKALAGDLSPEARRRAEQVLNNLTAGPSLRAVRGVETLERIGTAEARQLLETLAKGAAGTTLTREAEAAVKRRAKR